ncbi:MAG: FHA domain-containing protein [Candidatus Saccharimonas sp.]|nr:FHA domain-containing protein [Planctomycetaceae bacterium]
MTSELYFVIRHEGAFERLHQVEVPETTIGRSESNVLWLPDLAVSRRHAVLIRDGMVFVIRDLGSRNGIRLNDQPVREAVLRDAAEVQIGPYRLKTFFCLEAAQANADDQDGSTQSVILEGIPGGRIERQALQLTPAQRRVYDEFLKGRSEKEVASLLNLSIHTIHTHSKAIYKIFAVVSRAELLSHCAVHPQHPDHRETRVEDEA